MENDIIADSLSHMNIEKQAKTAHAQQLGKGAPFASPFQNRKFLNMMKEISKVKCNIEDFLDDRVPAINTQNFDQSLLQDTPKGIRSDKDMEGAWMFAQFILNRASVPHMKPYELVVAFNEMNDYGNKMKKLARLKQDIKLAKKDKNLEELERLKAEQTQVEASMKGSGSWSRMQRDAITQVVLIIGFIKEYVSVRAVKIENAEESVVFVPCYERSAIHAEREITKEDTFFEKTERILRIGKGLHTFYARAQEAISADPDKQAPYYLPITKKLFDRSIRVGNDRDDEITVQIPDDFKIGYMETEPLAVGVLTKMIEDSKAPTPVLTKEDLKKADMAEEVVTPAAVE